MFTAQEVKHALEKAMSIAADEGEALQDWRYFNSPIPQDFHVFRDAKQEYMLQVGRVVPEIWFCKNVSDTEISGQILHFHKKPDTTNFITAFFLSPEKTCEAIEAGEHLDSIVPFEL
jgi:hypothetical protein